MTDKGKIVGVIGGMGPEATLEFQRRLIAAVSANDDSDHIHTLVDNNSQVPSRIKALIEKTGEDPSPVLARMAKGLENAGADFLVMPCNTAHYYLPAIRAAVQIPVLDMIELSIIALQGLTPKPKRIGMLASPAVREVGLFAGRMTERGLRPIFADSVVEADLLEVIRSVKSGSMDERTQSNYRKILESIAARGADAFLIACTELSLFPRSIMADRPALDTLDILVQATVRMASNCGP